MINLTLASIFLIPTQPFAASHFDEQILARQDAFTQIENSLEEVEDALEAKDVDWQKLTVYTEQLALVSQPLVTLFPEGSDEASRAKKSIWESPADFQKRMEALNSAILVLADDIKRQDISSAEKILQQVNSSCSGCHRKYRSLW